MADVEKLWRSLSPAQRIACADCCARQWNRNASRMEDAVDAHAEGKYWTTFVSDGIHSTNTPHITLARAKPKTVAKLAEAGLVPPHGYSEVRYTREMGVMIAWVLSHASVTWLLSRSHDDPGTPEQIREVWRLKLTKRPSDWQMENGYPGHGGRLVYWMNDARRGLRRAMDQAQFQAVAKIDADQKDANREARAAVEKAKRDAAKVEHIERARRWAEGLVPSDDPALVELVEAYLELVNKHVGPVDVEDEVAA